MTGVKVLERRGIFGESMVGECGRRRKLVQSCGSKPGDWWRIWRIWAY